MAISKTTSTSDNTEPEFWRILKTPPKTQEEIYREVWREAIAAVRAGLYNREDLETHFEIKNENR